MWAGWVGGWMQAKKTETSIARLAQKSRRGAAESAGVTVSDTKKITAQLFLDVQVRGTRKVRRFTQGPLTARVVVVGCRSWGGRWLSLG